MENQKLGQEPAFACTYEINISGQNKLYYHNGMSKRFYAACQIAPSIISTMLSNSDTRMALDSVKKNNNLSQEQVIIGMVYEYVDELLKQE